MEVEGKAKCGSLTCRCSCTLFGALCTVNTPEEKLSAASLPLHPPVQLPCAFSAASRRRSSLVLSASAPTCNLNTFIYDSPTCLVVSDTWMVPIPVCGREVWMRSGAKCRAGWGACCGALTGLLINVGKGAKRGTACGHLCWEKEWEPTSFCPAVCFRNCP